MKHSIEDIRKEYDRLDRITGTNTKNVSIRISGRMTKKLGMFTVSGGPLFSRLEIAVSKKCMDSDELFYEVIRHEYAHAAVHIRRPLERHVHDSVWKSVCSEVGCRPHATIQLKAPYSVKIRPLRYRVVCRKCGASSDYKILSKVVKAASGLSSGTVVCRRCGGHSFDVHGLKESASGAVFLLGHLS